jgi:hypothetical protein
VPLPRRAKCVEIELGVQFTGIFRLEPAAPFKACRNGCVCHYSLACHLIASLTPDVENQVSLPKRCHDMPTLIDELLADRRDWLPLVSTCYDFQDLSKAHMNKMRVAPITTFNRVLNHQLALNASPQTPRD